MTIEPFPCPECDEELDGLNEDPDDRGVFVCEECGWEGVPP